MRRVRGSGVGLRKLAFILSLAGIANSTELPLITPQVSAVFPHGAKRGTDVQIELIGSNLDNAKEVWFDDPGLNAEIQTSSFSQVRVQVRVHPKVETGRHEFRLITQRGSWFGAFWVGSLDESLENEPNDDPKNAQVISLPALVNGRADSADGDYFRFEADSGQTIVFEVIATRLGSGLDPVLTLFDDGGRELAYNDDVFAFKDARLVHTFRQKGTYTILVSASYERSSRGADYRLLVSSDPYPRFSLPLGARRGGLTEVTLTGWNLERADRVWLGNDLAEARILERKPDALRFQLFVPETAAIKPTQLHVAAKGLESSVPVRFEIGDLPEQTIRATGSTRVPVPVVVNGELAQTADPAQRINWIEFDATTGQRYEVKADAWRFGQPLDPVITLFDPDGKMIGQEDDPAPNSFIHHPATHDPRFVFIAAKTGLHRVQVRGAAYEGGACYRLEIRKTVPDFEVEVRSPQLTIYSGRSANLLVIVRRTGGVHQVEAFRKPDNEIEHFRLIEKNVWNTPIRVRVEGLPEGTSAEPVTAEAKNTAFKGNDGEELFVDGTVVEIPICVNQQTRPGLYEMRVIAEGTFEGRDVRNAMRLFYTGRSVRCDSTRHRNKSCT